MKFLKIRALHGPNIWSRRTCLEVFVDLEDLKDTASNMVPGLYERLTTWLPGLVEHRCGIGERGGFLMRLREGTYPAHILEHITVELQNLAGTPVGFGKARETRIPGVYKVVVRYREENVARACLDEALVLLNAAIYDKPYDIAPVVTMLRDLTDTYWMGPSTLATVRAAEDRNIPFQRLNKGGLVQFGFGARLRRIWTAETDRTQAIGEAISRDKDLTKKLLDECGVPVPQGTQVGCASEAWEAANDVGVPVVVKPTDGNHGRGVFIDLSGQTEIEEAYEEAIKEGSSVIVEKYIRGNEHRLLVVGNKLVAAARGQSAWVTGDGKSTIAELVEIQLNSDPRRGVDENSPLNPVQFDLTTTLVLKQQGCTIDSIVEEGRRVMVQRNGNVSEDVTDLVHPSIAEHMVLAAKVVGLDVAGIDVVAEDISRPLEEQGGAVVEVNAGPGLPMHLNPASGKPRPVGEAILGLLFSENEDGRIPVVCVSGDHKRTELCRLVTAELRSQGLRVGTATGDGLYIGTRLVESGDRGDWPSTRKLLMNPGLEAVVVEAGAKTILEQGLGFDRCQVAVVTAIADAAPIPEDFIDGPEDMYTVYRSPVDVVLQKGTAVLDADDPQVARMAELSAGEVILFAESEDNPNLLAHRSAGGKIVFARDGAVVAGRAGAEDIVISLADIVERSGSGELPDTRTALAAVAAGWALHIPAERMAAGLADTVEEPQQRI